MNNNPLKGKVGNLSTLGFLFLLILAPFAANLIFTWVNKVQSAGGYGPPQAPPQQQAQSSNLRQRRGTPVRRGY